ncbi:MAG: hypothetical protein KBD37_05275 [Burkholderiales bacterium]|nr:hypothetical protein [Burkholderiales bacterium]
MNKSQEEIYTEQINFFKRGKSGCIFAALAATNPKKYCWQQIQIKQICPNIIDSQIESYMSAPEISTLSVVFPEINTVEKLLQLIRVLEQCKTMATEKIYYKNFLCYGFRLKVGNKFSWVSGFGPFEFLPKTRQAPYTEITCRIKDKPDYKFEMKKAPHNILHLADMDMQGMCTHAFKTLWTQSVANSEKIVGHKLDLLSAAKTSFAIPKELIHI